jgi:hypothetical protein
VRFDVLDVDGAGDDRLQPVRRRVWENVPLIRQVANARCKAKAEQVAQAILPTRTRKARMSDLPPFDAAARFRSGHAFP